MKKTKKILSAVLALMLAAVMLAACSDKTAETAASAETPAETVSQESSSSEAAETESEEESTEEETKVSDLIPDADGNITITDMAGREVTFPANPTIWNSSPTAEGWLCAIVPDQLVGFAADFSDEAKAYYPESVRDLPTVGGNFGNNTANVEGIISISPDIIVNTFDCSPDSLEVTVKNADSMQEQYGIPVVCLSRDIADTAVNAELIGLWFGQAERGAEVAEYLQGLMDKIEETAASVPENEIPSYYYAEGTDGLSTESSDSFHADVYKTIGLKAAVGDDVVMSSFGGMEAVSFEQVLQWDPDIIFVWNAQAFESITTDAMWAQLRAVNDGQVYMNPSLPQNWVDRSPNSLRILGCLFAAAKAYPDWCTYDLEEEVREFFSFMYDVELTDDQISALF